jgi:hypothetical protein
VPLKPFKKGLQRCPPKFPCQTQNKKIKKIMLPKNPLKISPLFEFHPQSGGLSGYPILGPILGGDMS